MKFFLEIQESKWLPGSNKKMIYVDKHGRNFLGPPISATKEEIVVVEASDGLMEDGYYHIIKIIDKKRVKKQS